MSESIVKFDFDNIGPFNIGIVMQQSTKPIKERKLKSLKLILVLFKLGKKASYFPITL